MLTMRRMHLCCRFNETHWIDRTGSTMCIGGEGTFLFERLSKSALDGPFTLPLKDDKQCIPRVLYRALLPPVQS